MYQKEKHWFFDPIFQRISVTIVIRQKFPIEQATSLVSRILSILYWYSLLTVRELSERWIARVCWTDFMVGRSLITGLQHCWIMSRMVCSNIITFSSLAISQILQLHWGIDLLSGTDVRGGRSWFGPIHTWFLISEFEYLLWGSFRRVINSHSTIEKLYTSVFAL